MLGAHKIRSFKAKYPWVGPAIWMVTLEYFVVQIVAAAGFFPSYDWSRNTISDLGNSLPCDGGHATCSPRYGWMNAAFIVLGFVMVAGSVLTHQEFNERSRAKWGFVGMGVAGVGSAIVGISPENVNYPVHLFGAFCAIGCGNLALLAFGWRLTELPKPMRISTMLASLIGMFGCVSFATKQYLGAGKGTAERVAAYPETIWLLAFGVYASTSHYINRWRAAGGRPGRCPIRPTGT